MMAIRLLIGFLILFANTLYRSQITKDSVAKVKEEYQSYTNSGVLEINSNLEWYILQIEKQGKSFSELHSVQNQETLILPEAYQFRFIGETWLIAPLKSGKTYYRNLETNKENQIDGSFQAFEISSKRLLMINSKSKNILLIDNNLNVVLDTGPTDLYDVNEKNKSIAFFQNNQWIDLNLLTLKRRELYVKETYNWIINQNQTVWALDDNLELAIWEKGTLQVRTMDLMLPSYLEVFQKNKLQADVRDNRYLLLSVIQVKKEEKEIADIFYTSLSYQYRKKIKQLAIYDTVEKQWIYLPKQGDLYSTEKFISNSEFVSYDLVTKNYDTIANPKPSIQLYLDWGKKQKHLKNRNINQSQFYYNRDLAKLLYFDKGRWMLEELETGIVKSVPIQASTNFLNDKESGLTDEPWDKVALINDETVILTEEYDLYSFNLRTFKLKRLTYGREKKIQYRLIKETDFTSLSEWKTNIPTYYDRGIMTQFFNRSDFSSGICMITTSGKEEWRIKTKSYIKKVKRNKNKAFYASSFYNKPLEINLVDSGKSRLINADADTDRIEDLRYRIFQYPNSEGTLLDAVLLYPRNYKEGIKYPMVVEVYENKSRSILNYKVPKLNDGLGFNDIHYVHQDYFVLLPQVDFKIGDLENSVTSSVTNVVQEALKLKDIDKDKIGLIGGSFGGYQATMLMGKTKLFRTAVAGVPVVDLPRSYLTFGKMLNQPEYWRIEKQQFRMGKSLFENWDSYLSNSPVFHMKNIDNPLLIWIGKDDNNVNPDQGRSFFIGLKRLQKKAVLLEYPNQGHNIIEPAAAEDLNVKIWQWFDYFLKDKPPAEWICPML